jgi:hypothetical protein
MLDELAQWRDQQGCRQAGLYRDPAHGLAKRDDHDVHVPDGTKKAVRVRKLGLALG